MKTIRNTTTRPIKVPLPRGKFLHLNPRKTGEVADRAVDHPPLAKLIAAEELEVLGDGAHADPGKAASSSVHGSSQGHHPAVNMHRRGDR